MNDYEPPQNVGSWVVFSIVLVVLKMYGQARGLCANLRRTKRQCNKGHPRIRYFKPTISRSASLEHWVLIPVLVTLCAWHDEFVMRKCGANICET